MRRRARHRRNRLQPRARRHRCGRGGEPRERAERIAGSRGTRFGRRSARAASRRLAPHASGARAPARRRGCRVARRSREAGLARRGRGGGRRRLAPGLQGPGPRPHGPRSGRRSVVLRVRVRRGEARPAARRLMEERGLGPVVGLGTWNTFEDDVDLAHGVVGTALENGCRLFDTSPMYGSERALASALEGPRNEATVATKIWAGSVDEGRRQFADQLRWFGRVEIEQVHNLVSWEEHLSWLEEERERGRIGRLGVTHYEASAFPELARALRTGSFSTLQVPYNPLERECERELLPLAKELGVAVIVMRPLGDKSRLRSPPPPDALAPLLELGISTWPQALIKWALSDDRIDVVIPATRDPDHVRENAAGGNPPWLGEEERALIERLART